MHLVLEENVETKLKWAKKHLKSLSVPNYEADAESILLYSLKRGMTAEFERLIRLRGTRYPLQYIIGSVDFMGLELKVEPGVFIPRPETELLVEKVIEIVRGSESRSRGSKILDLCTGCGAIAVALSRFAKGVDMTASDISDAAIGIAEKNIKSHNCDNIKLVKSDLFDNLHTEEFDIIVANPPYIQDEDFENLMPEVLYEPKISLHGGKEGLDIYRDILEEAPSFLKKNGYLLMEVGYNQADALASELNPEIYSCMGTTKDYNGIDRIIAAKRKDEKKIHPVDTQMITDEKYK